MFLWGYSILLTLIAISLMFDTVTSSTFQYNQQLEENNININLENINAAHTVEDKSTNFIRESRSAKPFGIFGFFQTLGNIKNLFNDQYNETTSALQRVLDVLSDGFTDTKKPTEVNAEPMEVLDINNETVTTTEKYRISRKEFGYILGKNARGLRKLFRIELDDALNQTKYNIQDYKNEYGRALAPYTIKKVSNDTTS